MTDYQAYLCELCELCVKQGLSLARSLCSLKSAKNTKKFSLVLPITDD
jgi:hypothetical protein